MGQVEQDGVGPWPLFGIELTVRDVVLNPLREADMGPLADIYPDDAEHDPGASLWSDMDLSANRKRLLVQGYWKNWGNWSPDSWCLAFRVSHRGRVVGTQSLEANLFPQLRTVDSGSWLATHARGHGVGTAMRAAILGFAFDHLGAEVAITSSRTDNAPSIAVSRRLGYMENGVSRVMSPTGPCELLHFRLDRTTWIASGKGTEASARGLKGSSPYFGVEVA